MGNNKEKKTKCCNAKYHLSKTTEKGTRVFCHKCGKEAELLKPENNNDDIDPVKISSDSYDNGYKTAKGSAKKEVEKAKQATRIATGSFKYDFAYDEIIKLLS